jgi:anti-sigma B factor antagonist
MSGNMTIEKDNLKDCLIVRLKGEFIFDEVNKFESFVKQNIGKNKNIAVDMLGLQFLDSSGMGSLVKLLNLIKQKSGQFYLVNVNEEIMKIIEVADLLSFFKIVTPSELNTTFSEDVDDIMRRL